MCLNPHTYKMSNVYFTVTSGRVFPQRHAVAEHVHRNASIVQKKASDRLKMKCKSKFYITTGDDMYVYVKYGNVDHVHVLCDEVIQCMVEFMRANAYNQPLYLNFAMPSDGILHKQFRAQGHAAAWAVVEAAVVAADAAAAKAAEAAAAQAAEAAKAEAIADAVDAAKAEAIVNADEAAAAEAAAAAAVSAEAKSWIMK